MPSLLSEKTVLLGFPTLHKQQVIEQLSIQLAKAGVLLDHPGFVKDVTGREAGGTAIGYGMAAPHARSCYAGRVGVAMARLAWPIDWDGQQTDLVFLMAVPRMAGPQQMRVLAGLFGRLARPQVREALRLAKTPQQVLAVLEQGVPL